MAGQNLSFVNTSSPFFKNIPDNSQVWMSHADTILKTPDSFEIVASTPEVKVAGFKISDENTYGIQFHPEVYHSTDGMILLKNYIVDICECHQIWTPDSFIESSILDLKQKIGSDKVILGLSGGVDSSGCSRFTS